MLLTKNDPNDVSGDYPARFFRSNIHTGGKFVPDAAAKVVACA
jgi:hypothetical protein